MNHRTSHNARITLRALLVILISVSAWFSARLILAGDWWDATFPLMALLILCIIARDAFRSRHPETLSFTGNGLIHDSGADPFRATHLEQGNPLRAREQFSARRSRRYFTRDEVAQITLTDIPYPQRIFLPLGDSRHDIGEALTPEARQEVYRWIKQQLRHGRPVMDAGDASRAEIDEQESAPATTTHAPYSRHAVDPLDFHDEIAQQANWSPVGVAAGDYRTRDLVREPGGLAFRATAISRSIAIGFMLIGSIGAYSVLRILILEQGDWSLIIPLVITLIFIGFGWSLMRRATSPISFDLRKRTFRQRGERPTSFEAVHGLQLISSHQETEKASFEQFEMNLLLKDGHRIHVLAHGDKAGLQAQAAVIAAELDIPVFDGIRGQTRTYAGQRHAIQEQTWSGKLLSHAPNIVLFTVLLWLVFGG